MPVGLPETKEEVIRRMGLVKLAEVDIPQEEVMPTLRDFEALAKYAPHPFRLSVRGAEEQIAEAHRQWLAERKPLPQPRRFGRAFAEWDPPEPAIVPPVATVKLRNTTLLNALNIICNVCGLEWSVDRWNGVAILFKQTEGQQSAAPLPSAPRTGPSEGAR